MCVVSQVGFTLYMVLNSCRLLIFLKLFISPYVFLSISIYGPNPSAIISNPPVRSPNDTSKIMSKYRQDPPKWVIFGHPPPISSTLFPFLPHSFPEMK